MNSQKNLSFLVFLIVGFTVTACIGNDKVDISGHYPIERSELPEFKSVCQWNFFDTGELEVVDCYGTIYLGKWDLKEDNYLTIQTKYKPMAGKFKYKIEDGLLTLSDSRYTLILDKSLARLTKPLRDQLLK